MARKTASDVYSLLESALSEVRTGLATLTVEVAAIKQITAQDNRALRGSDGNPGLVAMVTSLCDTQKKMDGRIAKIETCLHEGMDDAPGLVEQVRENTKLREALRYWRVLLIGAIAVGLINIALQLWLLPLLSSNGG